MSQTSQTLRVGQEISCTFWKFWGTSAQEEKATQARSLLLDPAPHYRACILSCTRSTAYGDVLVCLVENFDPTRHRGGGVVLLPASADDPWETNIPNIPIIRGPAPTALFFNFSEVSSVCLRQRYLEANGSFSNSVAVPTLTFYPPTIAGHFFSCVTQLPIVLPYLVEGTWPLSGHIARGQDIMSKKPKLLCPLATLPMMWCFYATSRLNYNAHLVHELDEAETFECS
jgi:hypothetical protein